MTTVYRQSGYVPPQVPKLICRCLRMSRAMRAQALGLYVCSSPTVSESTSPMTSTSVSGVVSTRTANFSIRRFGAITASLIGESRQSFLPTDPASAGSRRGSDWGQCVLCNTDPTASTDLGSSGFCESWHWPDTYNPPSRHDPSGSPCVWSRNPRGWPAWGLWKELTPLCGVPVCGGHPGQEIYPCTYFPQ
jgi:hypothetical protein